MRWNNNNLEFSQEDATSYDANGTPCISIFKLNSMLKMAVNKNMFITTERLAEYMVKGYIMGMKRMENIMLKEMLNLDEDTLKERLLSRLDEKSK